MEQGTVKTCQSLIVLQAGRVRRDVEIIRDELDSVFSEVIGSQGDDERISEAIRKVQTDQRTFHERILEIDQKLRRCKSLLASFHS